MQRFRQACMQGADHVVRHWPVLIPLYLISLLLGLVQSWPVLTAVSSGALRNPFFGDLADGGSDALVNLFLADAQTVATQAGLWVFLTLPLTMLFGISYNFFAGGILSVYAGTRPFWAGCRSTFWSFTALGLMIAVIALIVVLIGALFAALSGMLVGAIVTVVLMFVVTAIGEYARAYAIIDDRRNPFVLFGLAARFCVRRLVGVLGFVLLGVVLTGILTAAYGGLADLLRGSIILILLQQLVVFGWIGIKLLRLAWSLEYLRSTTVVDAQ